VWIGSGLDGIEGLTVGDPVTAEQMRALFGCGPAELIRWLYRCGTRSVVESG
jgi:hypothetical protein